MIKKLVEKIQNTINPNELFFNELMNNNFNGTKLEKIYTRHEINLNLLNSKNENYLYLAIHNGKVGSALWLLEKGIEINVVNKDGFTPFDRAIEN